MEFNVQASMMAPRLLRSSLPQTVTTVEFIYDACCMPHVGASCCLCVVFNVCGAENQGRRQTMTENNLAQQPWFRCLAHLAVLSFFAPQAWDLLRGKVSSRAFAAVPAAEAIRQRRDVCPGYAWPGRWQFASPCSGLRFAEIARKRSLKKSQAWTQGLWSRASLGARMAMIGWGEMWARQLRRRKRPPTSLAASHPCTKTLPQTRSHLRSARSSISHQRRLPLPPDRTPVKHKGHPHFLTASEMTKRSCLTTASAMSRLPS